MSLLMDMFEDILDQLEELVIILDPQGRILAFNREADRVQQALGTVPFKRGSDFIEHVPEHRKAAVTRILRQLNEEKRSVKTFAEYPTRSGPTIFLDLCYFPVLNGSGIMQGIRVIGMDVTPEKAFEKKMTDLVSEVTDLVENANALILSTDSRGYITHWNRHCTDALGYEKNDVFTTKLAALVASENRSAFESYFQTGVSGQTLPNTEIALLKKDGRRMIAMFSATPKLNADRRVTGITFVGQDITEVTEYRTSLERTVEARTAELREALRKQEEALEIKSKFVSIASHEFRTPLGSIQHTSRLLAQRRSSMRDEEFTEKLSYIDYHTTNMLHLLDDVLVYGKSERGKIKIVSAPLALQKFTRQVIEEINHSTGNTHAIRLSITGMPEAVPTDEKLMRNILINLLTNAIKFSPAQKEVDLDIQRQENRMVMRVSDRGIGIPPADLNSIFDPFLRGNNVNSIAGTGLGLSIVKKAVDLLDGEISLESHLGQGTTITVKLPLNTES